MERQADLSLCRAHISEGMFSNYCSFDICLVQVYVILNHSESQYFNSDIVIFYQVFMQLSRSVPPAPTLKDFNEKKQQQQ